MSLLKPLNTSAKIIKILQMPLLIVFLFPFAVLSTFSSLEPWISVSLLIVSFAALGFSYFKLNFAKAILTNSPLGYILAATLGIIPVFFDFGADGTALKAALCLLFFNYGNILFSYFFKYGCDGRPHPKNLLYSAFGAVSIAFALFIYIPSDSFINNIDDLTFAYQDFIFVMLIPFFITIAIIEIAALLLNKKFLNLYLSLLAGLTLCIFLQFTFFNSRLGLLDGVEMNWNEHTTYSVITLIVLLIFLAAPFIIQGLVNKVWQKAVKKIPVFVGLVELISLIILAVSSEGKMFEHDLFSLSGKEQYKVSENGNIITIVLDATDNHYIKEALEKRPEVFDGYEDFTLYTNTCSVFDSTFQSFTQIFSGYSELPTYGVDEWNHDAWSTEQSKEFFKRFHDANYKMNFFIDANWDLSLLEGRVDNIKAAEFKNTWNSQIGVINDFNRLTAYRTMPFIFKRFFDVDDLNINGNFVSGDRFDFYNEYFRIGTDTMELADSDRNYFIVEHIWGAHTPYDKKNSLDTTEYVLDIAGQYIDNLKKLGVYDNSTIIIMADHGSHDVHAYPDSTPLFMIKEANRHSDKMTLNSAPIYYTDLMSTYLVNAGLYDEQKDRELFGSSIYDFKEGQQRERIAHYRFYDDDYPPSNVSPLVPSFGNNVIYSYKYTGDNSDLLNATKSKPTSIDHMKEDAS